MLIRQLSIEKPLWGAPRGLRFLNQASHINPVTHELWALQNEDANPNLVIINPATKRTRSFKFGPTLHGGGYDDIVFLGCDVYISASNPARNPNTGPAIVRATLSNNMVNINRCCQEMLRQSIR